MGLLIHEESSSSRCRLPDRRNPVSLDGASTASAASRCSPPLLSCQIFHHLRGIFAPRVARFRTHVEPWAKTRCTKCRFMIDGGSHDGRGRYGDPSPGICSWWSWRAVYLPLCPSLLHAPVVARTRLNTDIVGAWLSTRAPSSGRRRCASVPAPA